MIYIRIIIHITHHWVIKSDFNDCFGNFCTCLEIFVQIWLIKRSAFYNIVECVKKLK